MLNNIITFLSAGIPGMLTFWLLSTFDIISYSKNDLFEKTSALAFFSFLNMGVGIGLYDFISRKGILWIYNRGQFPNITHMGDNIPAYLNLGICTLISTIFLSLLIYPLIYKAFMYAYTFIIKHLKLPTKSTNSVLWEALNKNKEMEATVYIFDFENNFIESGTAARLSDYDEEFFLSVRDETGYVKERITFTEVLEVYNSEERQKNKPEIVLDLKNKLKFIIIF